MDRLGAGSRRRRSAGGGGGGLEVSGADDPGRAEQLVRLADDAEDPVLAAGVGMVALGLLAVGVADLLERRVGRHAEDLERVDLEAELRHVVVSRRPATGPTPGRQSPRRDPGKSRPFRQCRGACRPLDSRLRRYDARATFRSSTPSSDPRSFWRNAGWVWMNSSLTVAIERSSIRPQVDPHPHARQQKHGLFAGDRLGRLQDAIRPADLVVQVLRPLGEQRLAGRALVL